MNARQLEERVPATAASLLQLLEWSRPDKRDENEALFRELVQNPSALRDERTRSLAFLVGVYARTVPLDQLTPDQVRGVWEAAMWALHYNRRLRQNQVGTTVSQLSSLLTRMTDADNLAMALQDLQQVLPDLGPQQLGKIENALVQLNTPDAASLLEALRRMPRTDERAERSGQHAGGSQRPRLAEHLAEDDPLRPYCEALEALWHIGGDKFRTQNYTILESVIKDTSSSQAAADLARLASFTVSSVAYRMSQGRKLTDRELEQANLLAQYSLADAVQGGRKKLRADAFLVQSSQRLRDRSLVPEEFLASLDKGASLTPGGLSEADRGLELVRSFFYQQRLNGRTDPTIAQAWVAPLAQQVGRFDIVQVRLFVEEITQHGVPDSLALEQLRELIDPSRSGEGSKGPLSFLSPADRDSFNTAVKQMRLPRLYEMLRDNQADLLSTLSQILADPSFEELRPPKARVPMQAFGEAKAAALSNDEARNRSAMERFGRAATALRDKSLKALAEEWRLFAAQKVDGRPAVISAWEAHFDSGNASTQQVWNLAVAYNDLGEPMLALRFLEPGLRSESAPLSHLRFALWTAIEVITRASEQPEEQENAAQFLRQNLRRYPLAECYLLWLHLEDIAATSESGPKERIAALGVFQRLKDNPISIPVFSLNKRQLPFYGQTRDAVIGQVESFRSQLLFHDLRITWRLWLNEFTDDDPSGSNGDQEWEWLAKVYDWLVGTLEEIRDYTGAREVAERSADRHAGWYNYLKKYSRPIGRAAGLHREICVTLFKLLDRINQPALRASAFDNYVKPFKELLDPTNEKNSALLRLVNEFIDTTPVEQPIGDQRIEPTGGDGYNVWLQLNAELVRVTEIRPLAALKTRLVSALALGPGRDRSIQREVQETQTLLDRLEQLETSAYSEVELLDEVDKLTRRLEALESAAERPELSLILPLVAAMRRALQSFTQRLELRPQVGINLPGGYKGIADDIRDTSVAVELRHGGSTGALKKVEIALRSSDEQIIQRGESNLSYLDTGGSEVVGVPVHVKDSLPESNHLRCEVSARYDWGVVRGLTATAEIDLPSFSFGDLLAEHDIAAHELPSPFTLKAIDFDRDDPRLFQGRERELRVIEDTLCVRKPPASPPYFYGIRKVGKTSLLNRVAKQLRDAGLAPIIFDLYTVDAHSKPIDFVTLAFLRQIQRAVAKQWPDVTFTFDMPLDHPHPLLFVNDFFETLRSAFDPVQPVALIDEFQFLVTDKATPLLDSLKSVYDAELVWLVLSGLQGPASLNQTRAQLTIGSTRVDFLDEPAIGRALREPLHDLGVTVPDSVIKAVQEETAGHPFFMSRLANTAMGRLNAEHRNVMVLQDIQTAAATIVRDAEGHFDTTWFSKHQLSDEERSAAIKFAHAISEGDSGVPLEVAPSVVSTELLNSLESKHILALRQREGTKRLEVKGRLLTAYLRDRISEAPEPPRPGDSYDKVGLFVDLENCIRHVPNGLDIKGFASALMSFARRFGRVETSEACAARWNLEDEYAVKLGFESSGFRIAWVSESLRTRVPKKDLADFLMLERMTDAETDTAPDIYVIISGDKDYYARVENLLGKGYRVHVVSSKQGALAGAYERLVVERRRVADALGKQESDFFVHDLDTVLAEYRQSLHEETSST